MRRLCIVLAIVLASTSISFAADKSNARKISLKSLWTGEKISVTYRIGGVYQGDALNKINYLMRDWRCKDVKPIDLELIDLLWKMIDKLKPRRTVKIISGYRSPGLNVSLRRAGRRTAPHSPHTLGKAIDVHFPGVPLKRVREVALEFKLGGVGYYPFSGPPFIHIDTGKIRQWAEGTYSRAEKKKRRKRMKLICDDHETQTASTDGITIASGTKIIVTESKIEKSPEEAVSAGLVSLKR